MEVEPFCRAQTRGVGLQIVCPVEPPDSSIPDTREVHRTRDRTGYQGSASHSDFRATCWLSGTWEGHRTRDRTGYQDSVSDRLRCPTDSVTACVRGSVSRSDSRGQTLNCVSRRATRGFCVRLRLARGLPSRAPTRPAGSPAPGKDTELLPAGFCVPLRLVPLRLNRRCSPTTR